MDYRQYFEENVETDGPRSPTRSERPRDRQQAPGMICPKGIFSQRTDRHASCRRRSSGMGRDPVTGEPQVRAYAVYRPASERVAQRARDLGPDLGPAERAGCGCDRGGGGWCLGRRSRVLVEGHTQPDGHAAEQEMGRASHFAAYIAPPQQERPTEICGWSAANFLFTISTVVGNRPGLPVWDPSHRVFSSTTTSGDSYDPDPHVRARRVQSHEGLNGVEP